MSSNNSQQYELQRLYEKWLKKSVWSTDEAVSLIFGLDPDSQKKPMDTGQLGEKLRQELTNGTLKQAAGHSQEGFFVEPVVAYQWARRQGVELPVELESLMEFVIKMTLPSITAELEEVPVASPTDDIERLLGACVSVLMNCPEECMGSSGKISLEKMLKLLDRHADKLFGEHYPALSGTVIRDIVKTWQAKLEGK